jgi:hypothetical protein
MSAGAQVAALCGVAVLLIALAIYIASRFQSSAEKRERKRRLAVHRLGRLGDALITEANDHTLYYSYRSAASITRHRRTSLRCANACRRSRSG